MKILYVKNNSVRAKKYQLRTIIYEEDSQKFVKKEAICDEAVEHLMNMKRNYKLLSDSIINPQVKLAKIVDETSNSLTFEYIDGQSLEERFYLAQKEGTKARDNLISKYITFLKSSFKTKNIDISNRDNYSRYFGDFSINDFDNKEAFDSISNIDLIFSNIIYKDNDIYLIDYEWVFDMDIPIEYVVYRSIYHSIKDKQEIENIKLVVDYKSQEKYFLDNVVMKDAFFGAKINYYKRRYSLEKALELKEQQMQFRIDELSHEVKKQEDAREYWQGVAESMRVKNRLKNLIKKIIPIDTK